VGRESSVRAGYKGDTDDQPNPSLKELAAEPLIADLFHPLLALGVQPLPEESRSEGMPDGRRGVTP